MSCARCLLLAAGLAAAAPAAWSQAFQMRASEIIGREVRTAQGERLAIRDLVIDAGTGKVEYVALGHASDGAQALQLYPISALRSVAGDGLVLVPPDESASAGSSARAAQPPASR